MDRPTTIFVHDIHPRTQHVSARRLWQWAEYLAAHGHRVVFLTQARTEDTATDVSKVNDLFEDASDDGPIVIDIPLRGRSLLAKARYGNLPSGLRQLIIACAHSRRGAHFSDWYQAAEHYLPKVIEGAPPDIVIATFGNVGNWAIAQSLAQRAGCPWLADVKDNWEAFTHPLFRRMLTYRFRDMAAMTAYSRTHAELMTRYFEKETSVIYSGFRNHIDHSDAPSRQKVSPYVLVSGSLYDRDALALMAKGLFAWQSRSDEQCSQKPVIAYAGREGSVFRQSMEEISANFDIRDLGYLDQETLVTEQRKADINAYIVNYNSLFQQKFLELAACGRPIVTVPQESEEAKLLASDFRLPLHSGTTPEELASALEKSISTQDAQIDFNRLAQFSSEKQNALLLNLVDRMIKQSS